MRGHQLDVARGGISAAATYLKRPNESAEVQPGRKWVLYATDRDGLRAVGRGGRQLRRRHHGRRRRGRTLLGCAATLTVWRCDRRFSLSRRRGAVASSPHVDAPDYSVVVDTRDGSLTAGLVEAQFKTTTEGCAVQRRCGGPDSLRKQRQQL